MSSQEQKENPEPGGTPPGGPAHRNDDNPIASAIEEARNLYRRGDIQAAESLLDRQIEISHHNSSVICLAGILAFEYRSFNRAIHLVSRATLLEPDNPDFHKSLGDILAEKGNREAACLQYEKALELQPAAGDVMLRLADLRIQLNQLSSVADFLTRLFDRNPLDAAVNGALAYVYDKIQHVNKANFHYRIYACHSKDHDCYDLPRQTRDCLFFSAEEARSAAIERQSVNQTVAVKSTQLCYYFGRPLDDAPDNLIALDPNTAIEFFTTSQYRIPAEVRFDPRNPEEVHSASILAVFMDQIRVALQLRSDKETELAAAQEPEFPPNGPLRVFLAASRLTIVMQHSSRGLARAFERLGCRVCFLIEENDYQEITLAHRMATMRAFNPHITLSINHLNNGGLHPAVFNFAWWQDAMPNISSGQPLALRERDFLYSVYPEIDAFLAKCTPAPVERLDFCIDQEIFFPKPPPQRRNKVVFVGSSYALNLSKLPGEEETIRLLRQMVARGEPITDELLAALTTRYQFPASLLRYDTGPIYTHVIRESAVEWLCELAPTLDLEVEVYGRWWEKNPIVAPYFKGLITHGPELARIYNEARYALSVSSYQIKSQRLAEIAACGAIPVVFDARDRAEPPFWENESLLFRTREELRVALTQTPKASPEAIAAAYSFDATARRLLDRVLHVLEGK
ncbi:MAG: hypothetical protein HQL57_06510 [Magnetococcales bacterium]|nr:hypothetical protein [Magnetococcales bacterium]MBF0156822.1 hypothetical protein [Magnetococcales bacterium]